MNKIVNWFKKDFKKINKIKSIIWGIIIGIILLILIIIAIFWRKDHWYNALSSVGAIGMASIFIVIALRLSLAANFIVMIKNYSIKKHNQQLRNYKNQQKVLYTKEKYHYDNMQKSWSIFIFYGLIYLLMIIIGLLAYIFF